MPQAQDAAALLAAIVSSSFDPIVSKTLDGTVTSWNEAAAQLFGYSEEEMLGQSIRRIIPPERQQEEDYFLARIAAGERIEQFETIRLHKDGSPIDVAVTVSPIRNASGKTIGASKIVRNVSHLKRAMALLRENEARLEREAMAVRDREARLNATFDNAAIGIAQVGTDGTWLRVNARLCNIVGYSAEELLARTFQAITHPDDLDSDLAGARRMLAGEIDTYSIEKRYLRKTGGVVWVNLTVGCVRAADGAIEYFISVVEDITERKKADGALRLSEARFRSLALASSHLVWTISADGRALEENPSPSWRLFTGQTSDEVKGLGWLEALHPDDRARVREIWERAVESKTIYDAEYRLRRRDGEYCWMLAKGVPMRDFDGGVLGWIGTCTDITERKEAEAALHENTERLRCVLETQREIASANLNYADLRQTILERMSRLLAADGACLEIVDGGDLFYEAATGMAAGFVGLRVKLEASLSGLSMSSNKILRADDTESDPRVDREACRRIRLRSMIVMPLRYDERSFGVLKLMSAHADAFAAGADQTLRLMQAFLGMTIARQRAQAALQENEEQLRTLADAIPQLAWMANADGWITWYNRRWYEYTGTTPEQMEGWGWQSVHDPKTLSAVLERWKDLIATGAPFDMVLPLRGADGAFRRFLTRVEPLKSPEGRVVRWFGTNTDVDELKRAEEALLKSNARLEKVLEVETVGVIFWDLTTGCMTGANDTFLKLMGYSRDDIEAGQLTWQRLTPPEYLEASLSELRKFAANGRVGPYEKEYFRKDGTRQWLIFAGSSLGGSSCVEFCVDVSARKKVEEALRASEERYRGMFQNAGTGIAITDTQGRFLSCNPAYTKMLGYSEEELLRRDFIGLVHPEDREANMIGIRRLVAQEMPDFEILNRYVGKGGQLLWVHKHVSLMRDEAGRPTNIVALAADMTERKEAEEHIKLLLREVNHRAKNMLALVQAVARQTIAATPEDFLQRFGERVRALAAGQDLLVKHEWRGVDLEELIRFQLAPFEDLIGNRVELNGPPLFIPAAAAQALGMAIHELATNASKYGALTEPDGRVDVRWHFADAENGEQAFVMSWSERGGPPVVEPARRGFGSKVLCLLTESSLNGAVDLDFAPVGLFWRLTCPATKLVEGSRPPAMARHVPASSPSRTGRRILVVEDEPLIALEVAHVLTEARFEVVGPTRDVAGALSLLDRGGCDAAVLDINLGHETSERVAIELARRRTPFVTLSGYSRAQQGSSFDGAPALAKPLKPELLVATITRCLAGGVGNQ